MKRRPRVWILAGFLVVGAYMTQFGACWILGANSLLPGVAEGFVDSSGRLFGLVNVCGIPDTEIINQGQASTIQNAQDDLVTVCPVTTITATTTGGGGV